MILAAFAKALAQMGDPRFRQILRRGVGLALLLLALVSAGLLGLVNWLAPDVVSLPWVGEVTWLDNALGWAAVPVVLLMSVVLMAPIASAMTALFLDEVADAVEAKHYPGQPPVRPMPWAEALRESAGMLGLVILANALAFALSLVLAPLAPFIFIAVNGLLLGREYFLVAALRREGREGARALWRKHRGMLWLAGCLMALPLSVPILNLLVPTLGAATFTHLYHGLRKA